MSLHAFSSMKRITYKTKRLANTIFILNPKIRKLLILMLAAIGNEGLTLHSNHGSLLENDSGNFRRYLPNPGHPTIRFQVISAAKF
jgi:hypothetical protein